MDIVITALIAKTIMDYLSGTETVISLLERINGDKNNTFADAYKSTIKLFENELPNIDEQLASFLCEVEVKNALCQSLEKNQPLSNELIQQFIIIADIYFPTREETEANAREVLQVFVNELEKNILCSDEQTFFHEQVSKYRHAELLQIMKSIEISLNLDDENNSEQAERVWSSLIRIYMIKIGKYIEQQTNEFEFKPLENYEIIYDSPIKRFFSKETWKSRVFSNINALKQNSLYPYHGIRDHIDYLSETLAKELTYSEIEFVAKKEIAYISKNLPIKDKYYSILSGIRAIERSLSNAYDLIALFVGEPGTGKTYLINSIIRANSFDEKTGRYNVKIPVCIKDGIEKDVINSFNDFMGTEFFNIKEINEFIQIIQLDIKITFIIDDIQNMCFINPRFFNEFKQIIEKYSKYDWLNWFLTINEYDYYLVTDDAEFIIKYCFRIDREDTSMKRDPFRSLMRMSELNSKYKVCQKILASHGIDYSKAEEQFAVNIDNIKLILSNPLMALVYANTNDDDIIDGLNICYFNFIIRFSSIKLKTMLKYSKRNLPSKDRLREVIEKDLDVLLGVIINNRSLCSDRLLDDLNFENILQELNLAHLCRLNSIKSDDYYADIGTGIKTELQFVFKLYWAFKIITRYYRDKNLEDYIELSESFQEINNELVTYIILYLDRENKTPDLHTFLGYLLKKNIGKDAVFFVAPKTKSKCYKYIINALLKEEYYSDLTRRELFSLIYFLTFTNTKVEKKCIILSKHFDKISEYNLVFCFEGSMQRILNMLTTIDSLKRCMVQFILCHDLELCRILGEIAAGKYYRIAMTDKLNLEEIIRQLINFINDNAESIYNSSLRTQKGLKNAASFIEYFLRYLFRLLIPLRPDNVTQIYDEMQLHKEFINNQYYIEPLYERFKKNPNYFEFKNRIAYIIRSSMTIEYGNYYCHTYDNGFKNQYYYVVSSLIKSNDKEIKKMAFHFISNTLIDDKNHDENLESRFKPLLKEIYEDKNLGDFCEKRKDFFIHHLTDTDSDSL